MQIYAFVYSSVKRFWSNSEIITTYLIAVLILFQICKFAAFINILGIERIAQI